MSIAVDTIDLTVADPTTGEFLTANVYYVEGVKDATDHLRPLSIGQLVMAICLQRAADLESQVIGLMETMNETSVTLEKWTAMEQLVLDYFENNPNSLACDLTTISYEGSTLKALLGPEDQGGLGILNGSQQYVRTDRIVSNADILYNDFMSAFESKMDEKNSFGQRTMIELQSMTNKRDQSYDMISNVLKSLNTVMTGIVNNT